MKRDTFKIDRQFLLDDRTSATIAGAKWGTMVVVAMMVTIGCLLGNQGFLHRFVFRFVNAGDRGEHHDIKGKYAGKNFHNRMQK